MGSKYAKSLSHMQLLLFSNKACLLTTSAASGFTTFLLQIELHITSPFSEAVCEAVIRWKPGSVTFSTNENAAGKVFRTSAAHDSGTAEKQENKSYADSLKMLFFHRWVVGAASSKERVPFKK